MAIIGILAAVTVPALPSILGGRGVQKAVGDVSGILELCRAEAMARRTYVYIGFANVTNLLGNSEIQIGAMSSLDGSTNTGTANLRPISKLIKVDRAKLVDFSGLPSGVRSAASADIQTNSQYVTGPDFANTIDFSPIGTAFKNASPRSITLTPQGEVLNTTNTAYFRRYARVGIAPARGTKVPADGVDGAVVTYHGGSGRVSTFRP